MCHIYFFFHIFSHLRPFKLSDYTYFWVICLLLLIVLRCCLKLHNVGVWVHLQWGFLWKSASCIRGSEGLLRDSWKTCIGFKFHFATNTVMCCHTCRCVAVMPLSSADYQYHEGRRQWGKNTGDSLSAWTPDLENTRCSVSETCSSPAGTGSHSCVLFISDMV